MILLWGSLGEAKVTVELQQNWCNENKTRFDFCPETSFDKIDFSHLFDDKGLSQLELEIIDIDNTDHNDAEIESDSEIMDEGRHDSAQERTQESDESSNPHQEKKKSKIFLQDIKKG